MLASTDVPSAGNLGWQDRPDQPDRFVEAVTGRLAQERIVRGEEPNPHRSRERDIDAIICRMSERQGKPEGRVKAGPHRHRADFRRRVRRRRLSAPRQGLLPDHAALGAQ
jgi:hypothetical protein